MKALLERLKLGVVRPDTKDAETQTDEFSLSQIYLTYLFTEDSVSISQLAQDDKPEATQEVSKVEDVKPPVEKVEEVTHVHAKNQTEDEVEFRINPAARTAGKPRLKPGGNPIPTISDFVDRMLGQKVTVENLQDL
ncbi:hypothetical protein PINS_up010192 [Pythium insidiosum]|nr:hypothetical protein PINS_up010192 [Pythium insidiosum]